MLKNYFKIAIRNLINQKVYSFINIAGLALGMAVCIIILLYVRAETSYDDYHEYKERIFRIQRNFLNADGSARWKLSTLAPSFVPYLEKDFPGFEHIARVYPANEAKVSYQDKNFSESRLHFAEADIFEILTIPLIKGNPKTALREAGSVVLSESTAKRYFGDADPFGKTLIYQDQFSMLVTGIMADFPVYSHFHSDLLISYKSFSLISERYQDYFMGLENFSDNVTIVYARLAKGVDPEKLERKIQKGLDNFIPSYTDDEGNIVKASERNHLLLMKVKDIHLYSHSVNEFEPGGDIKYVFIFSSIAFFILLVACINFMNLSTARAIKRAKEVGLRKVIGATRRTLIIQFLAESVIIAIIAWLIAILMVELALPYFSNFSGHNLKLKFIEDQNTLLLTLGILIVTGISAGIYPAFYLSAFQPITILRGMLTRGRSGAAFRKLLVVFQFAVSIILIICVMVIARQIHLMQNKDLGFDRENVLLIPIDQSLRDRWVDLKHELLKNPRILQATASKRAPSGELLDSPGFKTEVYGEVVQGGFFMPHNRTEWDFFKTYGMKIIAGRDFSFEYATDADEAFIINQTAAKRLGFKKAEDAIGAPMVANRKEGKIIGVVKDFHYESLHNKIVPILTYIELSQINTVAVRISAGDLPEVVNYVQSVWDQFLPGVAIEYSFLDQRLDRLYRNEQQMMTLFMQFSALAVIIACLGLFGLAAFSATQRTKEIGIRKVLGASVPGIVSLLSKDFFRQVLLANLIAFPVSWYVMNKWLQNFAYRIDINLWVFVVSGLLILLIALFTVSWEAIRAATVNPADSLRYE